MVCLPWQEMSWWFFWLTRRNPTLSPVWSYQWGKCGCSVFAFRGLSALRGSCLHLSVPLLPLWLIVHLPLQLWVFDQLPDPCPDVFLFCWSHDGVCGDELCHSSCSLISVTSQPLWNIHGLGFVLKLVFKVPIFWNIFAVDLDLQDCVS